MGGGSVADRLRQVIVRRRQSILPFRTSPLSLDYPKTLSMKCLVFLNEDGHRGADRAAARLTG
jgi:hypothetical protein